MADEFLTVYECAKEYNEGTIEISKFESELHRLILERDKLIKLCENTRIPANQYTCLRNMTINRQFLIDLKSHIKSGGKKPEINIFEFGEYLSYVSKFLR
ncbi:MAG: hypothetical protein GX800_08530 [Clostridiaceae bacterium]|nr:hypothetical protein [Clostridiaceae bacterium]